MTRPAAPEGWGRVAVWAVDGWICMWCGGRCEFHAKEHREQAACPTWWEFCHCMRMN